MPEKATIARARRAKRQGKAPSTQAGEFVREEIHHVREGKHGARSTKQAIAIGLSKARRAGVHLPAPRNAKRIAKTSAGRKRAPSHRRAEAAARALKHESRAPASRKALSRHARAAARRRSRSDRRAAARRAVRTKEMKGRRRNRAAA
jgi:hypothetical protein